MLVKHPVKGCLLTCMGCKGLKGQTVFRWTGLPGR